MPLISVCIPSYNRPDELRLLLRSIAVETFSDYEIVICEDAAPRGDEVAACVDSERGSIVAPVRLFRNPQTLGYDGNLRNTIDKAAGQYCLFMADDDLLCPGALQRVAEVVRRRPQTGVVLRSWANVDRDTGLVTQEFRYFPDDRVFRSGSETIATFVRRCVFISGLVLERQSAAALRTDRFDGTLLYQLYLAGCMLAMSDGYYISDILAVNRNSGRHYFGSGEKERGLFEPGVVKPAHSRRFLDGMLRIADAIQETTRLPVAKLIRADVGNYSYPFLLIQAGNRRTYVPYALGLGRMGLWRSPLFTVYFFLLLIAGPRLSEQIIVAIKRALGRTPRIGRVHAGDSVDARVR